MRWFQSWFSVVYIALCMRTITAQDLNIPGTWQDSTSNLSRQSREDLAYEAALPLSRINLAEGQPGLAHLQQVTSVYAALVLQDYYTGNSSKPWHDIGTVNLAAAVHGQYGYFGSSQKLWSDAIYWGLAFFYSYRTYHESALLDNAVDVWNLVYESAFITPMIATSGAGAGRNISFFPPSNCTSGRTLAGGVFWIQDTPNSTYVNMVSVGPFMTLSAYLFEETKNATYQQAAQLSLDFIINNLWNGTIVYDGIDLARSCQAIPQPFSLNQGWFVEGLSIWANVTQNSTLASLLKVAVPNIATFPSWSSLNGVVNDMDPAITKASPDQTLKGIFVRGLGEARSRNPGTDLARYIEAYITIQYNSILEHARGFSPNDSDYSRSWIGPPATAFEAGGNLAALDVLNIASGLESSSESVSASTRGSQSSSIGAIVGGIVGGVVAVVLAFTAIILYRRQLRRRTVINTPEEISNDTAGNFVEPFILRMAYNPPASSLSKLERDVAPSAPVSAPDAAHYQASDRDLIEVAEIPSLVHRLNNLLQGRQNELPPRYDG